MLLSPARPLLTLGLLLGSVTALVGQATPAPAKPSDPQIAHIAVTANTIDIDFGKLAQSRTSNPEVKQFATTMITDHSAVNGLAAALAKKLGVTPEDNAVSQSLNTGAASARAQLDPLKGKAFDAAYIAREVAYHQAVLDALDSLLIPAASNAELKQLLVSVRPAIAAHLEHAKRIQTSLLAQR